MRYYIHLYCIMAVIQIAHLVRSFTTRYWVAPVAYVDRVGLSICGREFRLPC